jgi:hypothetical protein
VDDAHIGHQVGYRYRGEVFDACEGQGPVTPLWAAETIKLEMERGQMTISSYMNRHNIEGGKNGKKESCNIS